MNDVLLMAVGGRQTLWLQILRAACLPVLLFTAFTHGQRLPVPVYVVESVEAQQRLQDISVLESAERWGDAAEEYQRLTDEFGDVLVRIDEYHFRGLIDLIHERLGHWPPSAMETYRRRFDDRAEREFARLGAEPAWDSLQMFIDRWWWTTIGRQAAEKLADQAETQGTREIAAQMALRLGRSVPVTAPATRPDDREILGERLGEPLWDISLDDLIQPMAGADWQAERTAGYMDQAGSAGKTRCAPVLAGDYIYIQDANHLTAVRSLSGRLAWRYRPHETCEVVAENTGSALSPTVIDGRVYALFDERQTDYRGVSRTRDRSLLVCLNAGDGKEIWRFSLLSNKLPQANARFISQPMAIESFLYVLATQVSGTGSKAIRLIRLLCEDGRQVGETHLFGTDDTPDQSLALGHLKAWGESLFAQAAPGVIACMSAATGRVRWLVLGEKSVNIETVHLEAGTEPMLLSISAERGAITWHDIDSGREIRTISMDRLTKETYWTGLLDGRLIVFGQGSIIAVDSKTCEIIWEQKGQDMDWIGRPFLYAGSLIWPTFGGLHALTGDGRGRYRSDWPASCKPIHEPLCPLVDRGLLWIMNDKRLYCCPTGDGIKTPVHDLSRKAKEDFEARLDLVALALRDPTNEQAALTALDTALLEADQTGRREGLLNLIVQQVNSPSAKWRVNILDALTERVEKLADNPARQAAWRLHFAHCYARLGEAARVLCLCRQILSDNRLRREPLDDKQPFMNAGRVAGKLIARIIKDHGREVYTVYEEEAERLLARAVEAASPALLEKILDEYPNALAAGQAQLALANLDRQSNHPIRAARRLLSLWHRVIQEPAGETWAPLLPRKMAESYFQAGLCKETYYWLSRGRRIYPDQQHLYEIPAPTSRPVLIDSFAGRRTVSRWQRRYASPPVILSPRFMIPNDWAEPLALILTSGKLEAINEPSGTIKWTLPVGNDIPQYLGEYNDLLLLATRHEVRALDRETGRQRWTWGHRPTMADSPVVDPEIFTYINGFAVGELHLVVFLNNGRLFAMRIADGEVLWQRSLDRILHGAAVLNDEHLVFAFMRNGQSGLTVLDAWTGRDTGESETIESRQVHWLDLAAPGVLIAAGGGFLAGYTGDLNRQSWELRVPGFLRRVVTAIGPTDMYLSTDGREVGRVGVTDGFVFWRKVLFDDDEDTITRILLHDNRLLVFAERSVIALDSDQGRLLWNRSLPVELFPDSIRRQGDTLLLSGVMRGHWTMIGYHVQDGTPVSLPINLERFLYSLESISGPVLTDHGLLIFQHNTLLGWSWMDGSDTPSDTPVR